MTKKINITPDGIEEVDLTPEEETQKQADTERFEAEAIAENNAKAEKENLKASAKAKLVSGEALTEEEANTIVIQWLIHIKM